VTEGGVDEAAVSPVLMNRKRFMSAGVFHKIPRIDDSRLAEIFAGEVLVMLVRKELLSPNGPSAFSPGGTPASMSTAW
jgi:hypothetical protein